MPKNRFAFWVPFSVFNYNFSAGDAKPFNYSKYLSNMLRSISCIYAE